MEATPKKQVCLRMILSITRAEDEKRVVEVFNEYHIPICFETRAKGTAPSELLDAFGLGGTTRVITVGFLPRFLVPETFEAINRKLNYRRRGTGVALTVPLTGLQGAILKILNDETREELTKAMEKDAKEMQEHNAYALVWVSVNPGYSDAVVDAARAAGARGGTVLKGRRRNSESVTRFLGISMQEEQDFVMIVLPREKKTEVMNAVSTACGLKTEAHGIVVSLPVDEVMGLE